MVFRLGTRKSLLAKVQSGWVAETLKKHGIECELIEIASQGDKDLSTPLHLFEEHGPGVFTKVLEDALLENRIDLAVHSLKDLPIQQPEDLFVACIPERATLDDSLLIHPNLVDKSKSLGIAQGASVGTSSLRREAQLSAVRPDLKFVSLRGNVPTRVDKVRAGAPPAAVLALAGLKRLQLDLSPLILTPLDFEPAPGQGALAVEIRKDASPVLIEALSKIHDEPSALAVGIERSILAGLGGGCSMPLGVRAERLSSGEFRVRSFLAIPGPTPHTWADFRRFDISGMSKDTLISKSVLHLQGK